MDEDFEHQDGGAERQAGADRPDAAAGFSGSMRADAAECLRPPQTEQAVGGVGSTRAVRADAQRNIDALLEAALAVFATSGVDAPVREIVEKAGVGIGTFYRHFPQRADLVAAVFRREVDACANAAPVLAAEYEPGEALARWMQRYAAFIATKRGLASALHSGNPAFDTLPAYFYSRLVPALRTMLDAATSAGAVRTDVDAEDLLGAVASLCSNAYGRGPEYARRMVALLVDGLRYGATSSSNPALEAGNSDGVLN